MSLALREPVNRTILLFDIEDFSRRDNVAQAYLRRELHNAVEDTLAEAGSSGTCSTARTAGTA